MAISLVLAVIGLVLALCVLILLRVPRRGPQADHNTEHDLTAARAIVELSVAIELVTCRSGLIGGSSGSVTAG